jgi:phosphatidylinositol alpha-1,6-mannosyltransferase
VYEPGLEGIMRALLLTDSFLPHAGGSRVYYYQLFRGWGTDQVTVLTKKVDGWREFDCAECSEEFRIVRRFTPLRSTRYSELPKGLAPVGQALLQACLHRPDVVFVGDLYPPGVAALLLRRLLRLPYVVFCHGEEITLSQRFRRQRKLRDRIYREAAMLVANSANTRRLLVELGLPSERICIITPGVDCNDFFPAPADPELVRLHRLEGAQVLLTVARLVPRKGHEQVLRAVAGLCSEFPGLKYVIVGRGPLEAELRRLAHECGISDRVEFVGYVPRERLADYYRLATMMVMPNREDAGDMEGFGMSFLEASATGKPVIGGRSGGAVEAVSDGESGCLIDADAEGQLCAAIRRLLRDPGLAARMGEAGAVRARVQFGWHVRAARLRELAHAVAMGCSPENIGREMDCTTRAGDGTVCHSD